MAALGLPTPFEPEHDTRNKQNGIINTHGKHKEPKKRHKEHVSVVTDIFAKI
jgi:hypothetical protein